MARHAYLIIAHNNWKQLHFLIESLEDSRNDFYLHIDAKATDFDKDKFLHNLPVERVFFVERTNVVWGDYSQIKSELLLLQAATEKEKYSYYHLLSGIDMPVKCQNYIHDFFDNGNYEYIDFDEYDEKKEAARRIGYHYLFQKRIGKNRTGYLRWIREKIVKIEKIIGISRCSSFYNYLGKGANWFSITDGFARYIVDNEKFIYKNFRYSICADEVFIQTLLKMSPYKDNWYGFYNKEIEYQNLRYTDWTRGQPYVFKKEEFFELFNSEYIFARKFDNTVNSCDIKEKLGGKNN